MTARRLAAILAADIVNSERELWPPFNFGHLWFLEHRLV